MSNTVRENDVDVEEIKSKMHPGDVDEALGLTTEAMERLAPLRSGYSEGHSPEILRALQMVIDGLAEALETDTPCVKCGGTDAPLHPNGRCGKCGKSDD